MLIGGIDQLLNLRLTHGHRELDAREKIIGSEVGDRGIAPIHQDREHAVGDQQKSNRRGQHDLILTRRPVYKRRTCAG